MSPWSIKTSEPSFFLTTSIANGHIGMHKKGGE